MIGRAIVEPGNHLRHPTAENLVVVGAGTALLGLVAMTANSTSTAGARTNAIAFYIAWAALTLASASRVRTSLPSAVVLAVLMLAMLWRVGSPLVVRWGVGPPGKARIDTGTDG